MEVIDIDFNDIPTGNVPTPQDDSVNFGTGIELLMNDKKKTGSTKVDLGELDNLEAELNTLSAEQPQTSASSSSSSSGGGTKQLSGLGGFSNLFSFNKKESSSSSYSSSDASLGQATKDSINERGPSTWDGFTKAADDVPMKSSQLTEREKRRKKRMMIKKLDEWREKGTYKHGTQFDMDSNYDEVEDEYEGALEEKRKKDSIKLQGWWFTTVINTLEYGNALLNPFDLNLDGWGEQVTEDLDSYDEIFSELHEKYKGGKMAPEISLLLRVGFSAAVVNMSNKMLSSATPGFSDVIKQSPELMKMFSNAAVDTMSQQNSAFDFAKTMMQPPEKVNTNFGPPPAPIETKKQAPPQRPGMQFTPSAGNRPDLAAANKGPMFREQGVDMNQPGTSTSMETKNIVPPRPEMRGPPTSDIDQLLSGLKKKPEPISAMTTGPPSVPIQTPPIIKENVTIEDVTGDDSMISISSLKDMNNTTMPKRVRKRRNNSDKNSVSLDI